MTVIDTSTAATATAYSNQRKVDRNQDGTLWIVFWNGNSSATNSFEFWYSKDNGATWTHATGSDLGFVGTGTGHIPECSFFIDIDDYLHFVYKDRHDGHVRYRRGTPNASRTAWTWSSAVVIEDFFTVRDYPDIVAHREGTGWVAHIVYASSAQAAAHYLPVIINASGGLSTGSKVQIGTASTSVSNQYSWPSIDFHHAGDGKTVKDGVPHLYVAWSRGSAGSGSGIRFKKATYSSGSWTWGTEREIDSARFILNEAYWLNCLFDGTRVIIGGTVWNPSTSSVDHILHDRDVADTTTTSRLLWTETEMQRGSMSYDSAGNVYFLGQYGPNARYRRWTRSTSTLEPYTSFTTNDNTGEQWFSCKRGFSNSRIEFLYRDKTASPFDVVYGSVVLNQPPNVPTNVQRTGVETDATPNFSCDVSDPNSPNDNIKARFELRHKNGAIIGTVDSAFRTGNGTVTAEWNTALTTGFYEVRAKAIDEIGAESAYSGWVEFRVTENVSPVDRQFLWNVFGNTTKEHELLWNVAESNRVSTTLSWNIRALDDPKDLVLVWDSRTPWKKVPDNTNIWERII